MTKLIDELSKLHTTELGLKRIRRNLCLKENEDVVLWCREAIRQADCVIRKGKNWYAFRQGVVVTINARSNTIITAKPINAIICHRLGYKNINNTVDSEGCEDLVMEKSLER